MLGKGNRTPPYSSKDLFFAKRNRGNRGTNSVVDMVSLGSCRVFVSTTGLEGFPAKFSSKIISFNGGSVRFLLARGVKS